MIEVVELSRRYGAHLALDRVSFGVSKGEVVGFLGPNGAGKSTTMRILVGALGPTGGVARVAGLDVLTQAQQVKRKVGWLPERPPLYEGMTVRGFVRFAADLRGVAEPARATEAALERVGLVDVPHRIVGHLSKGYRQRVGLAQALVHDPEVLILDEPTSGLDPAQRVEIRQLIQDLARDERTIVLSTHVLAEVEEVCQRVIIIRQGRVVAQGAIDELTANRAAVEVEVVERSEACHAALCAVPGVREVVERDGVYRVEGDGELRPALAAAALPFGLLELRRAQGLEEVFLRLTGEEVPA